MRNIYIFLPMAVMGITLQACKPGEAPKPKPPIIADSLYTGRWSLVNDSTILQYWGIWADKPQTGLNYKGKPGDYYNFTSGGTVYLSENDFVDTATYIKMQLDTMELQFPNNPPGNPEKLIVSKYTQHTTTLTDAFPVVTPEILVTHMVNLKR
jgi:hypothetical protein